MFMFRHEILFISYISFILILYKFYYFQFSGFSFCIVNGNENKKNLKLRFHFKKRGGSSEVDNVFLLPNETYSNHFGDYKMVECVMYKYEI